MDTFNHLKMWLREVQNEASNNALIFLVGNKKDKEQDREVDYSKGLQFKEQNNLSVFMETSARSGENVEQVFMDTAKMLFKQYYRQIREQQLQSEIKKSGGAAKKLRPARQTAPA